jgi:hypothetical protein
VRLALAPGGRPVKRQTDGKENRNGDPDAMEWKFVYPHSLAPS